MKKNLLFRSQLTLLAAYCLVLLPTAAHAQWQEYQNRLNDPTVPAFVKAMSAPKANVQEVIRLYEQYNKEAIAPMKAAHDANPVTAGKKFKHPYQHLYKVWRSETLNYITPDGFVDYSPEADQARQELTDRIHPKGVAVDRDNASWEPIGPINVVESDSDTPISWQADIFDMAMVEGYPTIYAASEKGGLFRSENNGLEWQQVGTDQSFTNVQAVAMWPSNYNYVRIGVPGKLLWSEDGGNTWVQCAIDANGGTISPGFQTYQIILSSSSTNESAAFAATSDGLLISNDYGKSWKKEFFPSGGKVTSIAEHPTNPAIIYILKYFPASKMSYVLKSVNFGGTWELMNGPGWFEIPTQDEGKINVYSGRIVVTPAAPETIYVMLNETDSDASANLKLDGFIGIYRSENGGSTWTRRTGPLGRPYNLTDRPNLASWGACCFDTIPFQYRYNQVWYLNNALAVSTLDANHLYASGLSMWESTDGGATWKVKGGYSGNVSRIHPDIRRIKFRKTSSTTEELYWCSDGGINYSPDGSLANHEARNNGLFAHEFFGLDLDKRVVLLGGGSNHNGNNFTIQNFDKGVWKHAGGAETATGYVQYGETPKIWFTEYAPFAVVPPAQQNGNISSISTILDKAQWRPNPTLDYTDYSRASRVIFDPGNPRIIYWGHEGKFCTSDDDGQTARVLHDFGNEYAVQWIEQSQNNPKVMYVKLEKLGTENWPLYRTADGGNTWELLINEFSNFVFTIQGDLKVYLASKAGADGQKVYYSPNGGQAFINITQPVLNGLNIPTILSVEGMENNLFIATNNGGVFNYNTASSQWVNISQGLHSGAYPTQLTFYYPGNTLVLATRGLGAWALQLDQFPNVLNMGFASDFDQKFCLNEPIHFFNRSSNSGDSDYTWLFPNGNPSTSSEENPVVTYGTPGTYPVSLVINDGGFGLNGSITKTGYITVSGTTGLPFGEGFESGLNPAWSLNDANNNGNVWQISVDAGGFGNSQTSLKFDNYNTDEGGSKDELRTFKVNLANATAANLKFDVAYATYSGDPNAKDSLAVLVSTDCGKSFTQLFLNGGQGLSTAPAVNGPFVPTANQWQQKQLNLAPYLGNAEVQFKFQNWGHYGNNLYLDNINVSGTLVGTEEQIVQQSLLVAPNPNAGQFRVQFDLPRAFSGMLSLTDPMGRVVYNGAIQGAGGKFEQEIQVENLASGIYLLRVQGNEVDFAHKIMIQK